VNAAPRRYLLIGDPVEHSRSPALYRAAFSTLGIRAVYEAVRIPATRPDLVGEAMRDAATSGGNITLPHKVTAASAAQRLTAVAARTATANCFWRDPDGRVVADNTDAEGFARAARDIPGLELRDATVLVLGAGGAARAVALVCHEGGARRIDVCNRSPDRAEDLVATLQIGDRARVIPPPTGGAAYDLVVNATSLGLRREDRLPISLDDIGASFAMDLVYGMDGTSWTAHARRHGIRAYDGTSMLIHQAVLSLERWLGPDLTVPRVLEAMRDVCGRGGR